jgi:arsenite oxidase small subunit
MNRRDFIKLGGAAAGAAAILPAARLSAAEPEPRAYVEKEVIGKAGSLKSGEPVNFSYPDADSPCRLIRTGKPAVGGVGPDRDIVAFSMLCTHQGCPTTYDPASGTFKCPCHYSIFDPEKGGQQVCGQGTSNLPQIELVYDSATDAVRAVGVIGLIYGRTANIA